ncbi:MAG: L-threonylcarbamoyladenylate synthase [candidate division WOR-3 bacterium]
MKKETKKVEVFLFPTDTIPGIGCFLSTSCVERLKKIKKRPQDKPFQLILGNVEEIKKWVEELPPVLEKLKKLLPGGLTLILKGKKDLPPGVLSKEGKIGIRIPNHKELRNFINKNKLPLVATSANISGEETPKKIEDVKIYFDKKIEGKPGSGKASTVLDISDNSIIIQRKGDVSILKIERIVGEEVKLGEHLEFNVLFVCSANKCRSPMAEIHLRNLLSDLKKVNIRSAGILGLGGMDLYEDAKKVLEENNLIFENFSSTLLTKSLTEWADLILIMDDFQKKYIMKVFPESMDKVVFLRNFRREEKEYIIEDPAGKSLEECRKTFNIIKEANKKLEEYLRNKFKK